MRKLLHSNLSRRLNQTLGAAAAAAAPKSTAGTLSLFASSAASPHHHHHHHHHHLLLRRFHSWRSPSHRRGRLLPPAGTLGFLSGTILFNAAAATRGAVSRSSAWLEISSLLVSLQRRSGAGHLFSSIRRSWTYWIQSPDGVVQFLIGTNIAVFLLWRIADPLFMRNHFMISLDNFRSGRLHTLLTSAFSHSDLDHLVTNMIGLYFFGLNIANLFGPQFLLKLYLAGALTGSVFFLVHKAFLVPPKASYRGWDDSRVPALGASAAVNAIILLEVFLFPTRLVYLYFVVPVPAMLVGALLIGSDLWRIKTGQGHVSGSAHLGGAFVAALAWARIKKGWF